MSTVGIIMCCVVFLIIVLPPKWDPEIRWKESRMGFRQGFFVKAVYPK